MEEYSKIKIDLEQEIQSGQITIVQNSWGKGLSKEIIQLAEEVSELKLCQALIDLFVRHNGINIYWKSLGEPILHGKINFLDMNTFLYGPGGDMWRNIVWFDDMQEIEKQHKKLFHPLDMPNNEEFACLKVGDGSRFEDRVYLISVYEDQPFDMHMTIRDYFYNLLKTKGVEWWQRYLKLEGDKGTDKLRKISSEIFPNSLHSID